MLGLFKREKKLPTCSAVIVAAGSSQRMGTDKLMAPLGDINVLGLTLTAFEKSPLVNEIIVVTREDRLQEIADLCTKFGIKKTSFNLKRIPALILIAIGVLIINFGG